MPGEATRRPVAFCAGKVDPNAPHDFYRDTKRLPNRGCSVISARPTLVIRLWLGHAENSREIAGFGRLGSPHLQGSHAGVEPCLDVVILSRACLRRRTCRIACRRIRFTLRMGAISATLFKDDDLKELYHPDNGRPSLPPSLLSGVLLLQFYDDVSQMRRPSRATSTICAGRWRSICPWTSRVSIRRV